MSYSQIQFDEKTFVDRMLSNIHDLVCKSQPSVTDDNWFTKVERRNCIERMHKDYERAIASGFEWAGIFDPSQFVPNWSGQLRFVQEIDSKRFSFIQFCDVIFAWLNQLADAYQEQEPAFSSRLRGVARRIDEVRGNYTEPITQRKSRTT